MYVFKQQKNLWQRFGDKILLSPPPPPSGFSSCFFLGSDCIAVSLLFAGAPIMCLGVLCLVLILWYSSLRPF